LLYASNPFHFTLPAAQVQNRAFRLSESKVSIIDQLRFHSEEKEGEWGR
jgi:hypothetical protein